MNHNRQCWCGEDVVHEEWCREHAPRCRSGAHFKNNCRCTGSDVRGMMIDSFIHMIRQRVEKHDNDLAINVFVTTTYETKKLLAVAEAAVAWSRNTSVLFERERDIVFTEDHEALFSAVKGLGR